MNPKLKIFLETEDLDDLLSALEDLDKLGKDDRAAIRSILKEWKDAQAVSNLLMHPYLIPKKIRLLSILRGLDEREEYYFVLASILGLQRINPEKLSEEERLAILERLFHIIDSDDGVSSARASLSMQIFLREKDGSHVFRFITHPNETTRHNALAWLIEAIGSKDIDQFKLAGEISGVSSETLEYAMKKLEQYRQEMESNGSSKLVMRYFTYIPNLRDIQRPA